MKEKSINELLVALMAFCFGILFVTAILWCGHFHVVDNNDYERVQLQKRTQDLNHKYYNYYVSTENLLDNVLEENDTALMTDYGSKYLNARKAVTTVLNEKNK